MAEKREVTRYDFENGYHLPSDINKDQIKFDRLGNGYSVSYEDEKKYEDPQLNLKGYSARSMVYSETFGKNVKDVKMEIDGDRIKVMGWFE